MEDLAKVFERCIVYNFENSSIVIKNNCDSPVDLKALEIEYYIYISRAQSSRSHEHVELGRLRKRVVERVSVEQVLHPKTVLSIHFGLVKNIENVYVVVKIDNKEYKIKISKEKQSK